MTAEDSEVIGDLNGPMATVDTAGSVTLLDNSWQLSWAIGSGDRWRIASQVPAVRSRLLDDMPVAVTSMRVSDGDVVLRAAAARTQGPLSERVVVLEFSNHTPAPQILALAVSGSIRSAQVQGSCLLVDNRVAVDLGCQPRAAVAVADGQIWPAVSAQPTASDCAAHSRAGLAAAAVLIPLVPRVPLRAVIPIAGRACLGQAVSPASVAGGWRSLLRQAASLDYIAGSRAALAADTVNRVWQSGIAAAILAASGATTSGIELAARAVVILDRVGLPDEADKGRQCSPRQAVRFASSEAEAMLRALASRRLCSGRVSGLGELAGPLVKAVGDCDPLILQQIADVLDIEAPAAARDARHLLAATAPPADTKSSTATKSSVDSALRYDDEELLGTQLQQCLRFGGGLESAVAGIEKLIECLITETSDQLMMLPAHAQLWESCSVDAASLVTRHGLVSFSLRWHGPRPALLWELQPCRDVTLRCGLDDYWSARSPSGEALLRTRLS